MTVAGLHRVPWRCRLKVGPLQEIAMTLCPGALTIGCRKCPIFKVCPAKGVIGDYRPDQDPPAKRDGDDSEPRR